MNGRYKQQLDQLGFWPSAPVQRIFHIHYHTRSKGFLTTFEMTGGGRHFDPPEAGGEEIPLPTISFKIDSDDIVSFYFDLAILKKSTKYKPFFHKRIIPYKMKAK
ncbi:hypothetical protein COY07_00045 [Candidatus Peregrinibacteria bacterium CG_4_10_14_0_2_um_filter_43_11]|nr:MAG: hypothetical protein COY07_00045 [Candidatus Peregrinibacteria bacterium CG_4_10_14_0_2_um_filter_43_11]